MTGPSDAAIEAAAEAMEDAALNLIGRDLGTIHRNDIARAALSAALPLIREELARELDTRALDPADNAWWSVGMADAARIVRGDG